MAAGNHHRSIVWQVKFTCLYEFCGLGLGVVNALKFTFFLPLSLSFCRFMLLNYDKLESLKLVQIAEDYSHCEFLIRLPGYCPSMHFLFHNSKTVPSITILSFPIVYLLYRFLISFSQHV